MAGDVRADQGFDDIEQLGRGPELAQAGPEVAQVSDPDGSSRALGFERGETRAEPVIEVEVPDPTRRVEAPSELVHDRGDIVNHRLHFLPRQQVLDD